MHKGFSLVESIVAMIIVSVGFIAVSQLASQSISQLSNSSVKNKLNFLASMIAEDIHSSPYNLSTNYTYNCNLALDSNDIRAKWKEQLNNVKNCPGDNVNYEVTINNNLNDDYSVISIFLQTDLRQKKYLTFVINEK